jgi:hypothetical protein
MADVVSGLLGKVSRLLNAGLVEQSLGGAQKLGHYAVLAGAGLTLVYAIYGAIRSNSFAIFAIGLGLVAALAVGQFAAIRFLNAATTTIATTPSRVSSSAFLECAGLLTLVFAVTTLLGGSAGAIAAHSVIPLMPALIFGVILTCLGAIALHPELVNVQFAEGSAGEEAIGLLSFLFKTGLKMVPMFFVLFAVGGALAIVTSFFGDGGAITGMAQGFTSSVPLPVQVPPGLSGSALILIACLVPIVSYFIFLLEYLFVDVLRAVLSVPNKLDALRR